MVASEEGDEYQETAIGYAIGVLTYMQNGGKLSSIESTASEIVRLAGREVRTGSPGPLKAMVLMESAEEMRLRHNNLDADKVFEDMMAQARYAGRLRKGEQDMRSFKDIASHVVTVHENKNYRPGAEADADHVVEAIKQYGKWVVLAAAALIDTNPREFADIPADQVMDFLEENYLQSGATVGAALEAYAKEDLTSGRKGELGKLYDRLDKMGGIDLFDWKAYAFAGMTPTIGMHFVEMPVPAGEDAVFVFGS